MWSSGIGHSVAILPESAYEKNRYDVFWSRVSAHVSCLTSHALPHQLTCPRFARRLEKIEIEIIPEIYRYDCSKYGTISAAEVSS